MTEQGVPKRHNTLIDIPDSLRLPHFMVVDDVNSEQASNGLSQEYKLVLQSVVCHRGDSLHSGHYVAFARVAPKLLTDNRRHDHDPPPDYEEAQWVKFDDLAIEQRVTYVDDIKESLREEMPYLLFYQIVPMVDVTAASTDGSVADPPSYIESATAVPGTPGVEVTSDYAGSVSRPTSGYFDSATTLPAGPPSIRLSSDVEQPTRYSFDGGSYSAPPKTNSSRRGSISFSEPAAHPSGVSPEATTPVATPQDESTGTRLSRAAAMFSGKTGGSKSRATSQVGEGRMSITMSRLGFGRTSKELPNGASGSGRISSEVAAEDRPAPVDGDEAAGKGKERDKDKEHHGPHLPHPKKDRNKSKSREKEKDKGKASKEAVPDRECMVM